MPQTPVKHVLFSCQMCLCRWHLLAELDLSLEELALHVWDLEKTYRRWVSCRPPKHAVRGATSTG